MPTSTLCRAMRSDRPAIAIPSLSRRPVHGSTTSAASDDAVEPLAPTATPTSATASAGATLMPSPTMTSTPPPGSLDGLDLLCGGRSRHGSTPRTAPTNSATSVRSPVTMTTRPMPHRRRRGWPGGVRPDRVVQDDRPRRLAVDPDEHRQRALRSARPRMVRSHAPAARREDPRCLADGDACPSTRVAVAGRGLLIDRVGELELQIAGSRRPDDRGGEHVRRHLVERGGEAEQLVAGDRPGGDDLRIGRGNPRRQGAGLVEHQHRTPGPASRARHHP